MQNTTLCYLIKDDKYLMLHRNVNKKDPNYMKWIGVGGKCFCNEDIESCLKREVKEETAYELVEYKYHGIVKFVSNTFSEIMHLFTSSMFKGVLKNCEEGDLNWIEVSKFKDLNMWEGDYYFLHLLKTNTPFFEMTLNYFNDELKEVNIAYFE